jgi:CSLREA domain-containing protein
MKYLSLALILFCVFSAHAATFTVTRNDDRNATCSSGVDCSLREAVKAANSSSSNDSINFSGVTLITLAGEIEITNSGTLAINGGGANVLTVSGNNKTRIFHLFLATAAISGVTLTGGNGASQVDDGFGGAILARGGSLTLDRVHVTGNTATATGGVLLVGGIHQIISSTISGNTSKLACGGLQNGLDATLTVVNSTISGNTSGNTGGGLCSVGATILRNVTITNNTAAVGGGGIKYSGGGTLVFGNTIVAGNTSNDGSEPEISLPSSAVGITSAGNNLVGDSPGDSANVGLDAVINYQSTDILDQSPMLGELRNNGGTTPTHALLFGSPAIDKGNNSNSPGQTDQRGFTRIINGFIDIGAFEFDPQSCIYTITPTTLNFTSSGGVGSFTLTTQPGCAFTTVSSNDFIRIDYGASGTASSVVYFSVQANTGAARTGTITIGGQTFTVNQSADCSFTVNVNPQSFTSSGGVGIVTVTTQEGCAWSVSSPDSWISIATGAGGAGSEMFDFTIARNSGVDRTGTLIIAGQTFTIAQTGKSRKKVKFFESVK